MALLALLIIPVMILEQRAPTAELRDLAIGLNWLVWLAFCSEYLIKLALADAPLRYARDAWFDLLIIVLSPPFFVPQPLQGARVLRGVRLLRLLRVARVASVAAIVLRSANDALRHRRFHWVLASTAMVVSLGAIGIFVVEHGVNQRIQSIGDAFWWAMVTATTVGYGDVSPVTGKGRLIAVVLMLVGIGFIGVFTSTITSFFFAAGRFEAMDQVEDRLERIERKLDELMRRES